jgi:hydroxyethylthiazole kinase-like uncharacterized protein yjeF
MAARVASADESTAAERATFEAGDSAAELMQRAGNGAAAVIAARYESAAQKGVMVCAGSGNNGGDGWVVARSLARNGFPVSVIETAAPRSIEATEARKLALRDGGVRVGDELDNAGVIVDALLGTGSTGAPRGDAARLIARIAGHRASGATVVALDLPSGLDATTGVHDGAVLADSTVSFGTVKRGHLLAREVCGDVTVLDIGLRADRVMSALPLLVDEEWVRDRVPSIPVEAHKGTRKSLAIVGGGKGMAGAAILAGDGALHSGIGLLRIIVAAESIVAVHAGIPAAIVASWPREPAELEELARKADAVVLGPGLGRSGETRDLLERILLAWSGPVVLDADALNDFSSDVASLAKLLRGRPAILTPHPAEMARLLSIETAEVLARRFDIGAALSRETGAAVLLKGVPTVIFSPSGDRYVSASGTAALATGGSGDVLSGIAGTLLAQMHDGLESAAEAAACAAFVHGRAAELCRFVRGVTLYDILNALPVAWNERPRRLDDGVLAFLESHS